MRGSQNRIRRKTEAIIFHLDIAENANVDVFLTTDDHLIALATKIRVKIKVLLPDTWLKTEAKPNAQD